MNTGQYISGAVHIGLIGWLLVGDVFRSEPPEPIVTDVSVISTAEFEALLAGEQSPDVQTDLTALSTPTQEDQLEDQPRTESDTAPDFTLQSGLQPPTEEFVPEAVPEVDATIEDLQTDAPEIFVPEFDAGPDVKIDDSEIAKPRDAERIAPIPVLRPELDVSVSQEVTEAASQQEAALETVEEQQKEAAPEEATTEIVTEAEKPAGAPTSVPIPRLRPAQTSQTAKSNATASNTKQASQSAMDAALSEALSSAADAVAERAVPSGPPLTQGETEALRVAVSNCWNTGSLSSAALRVTVVVSVRLEEDGKPVGSTIVLESSTGGDGEAVTQAFEAARRAILRCGVKGYDLPPEKFGQWRDIEMTFNPEKMRIK